MNLDMYSCQCIQEISRMHEKEITVEHFVPILTEAQKKKTQREATQKLTEVFQKYMDKKKKTGA